jgi:glycosyltransferase involved in cell wall biosynthesis
MSRTVDVLWVEPVTLGRRVMFAPEQVGPRLRRMTVPAFPLNARNARIRRAAVFLSRARALRILVSVLQRALVRRAVRRAGDETVCFVENFQLMHVADAVRAKRVLFDYIDDAFGFTTFPPYVHDEWLRALERADAVSVTSPTLRRRVLEARSREVYVVRNGVEFERFAAEAARPPDFPTPGTPVVGYVGSIYPWIDFDLLDTTIGAMADFRFVMVGPLHPAVSHEMARLARHPNFLFLGPRPYADVPAYMRNLDAAMIPFKRTLLTEGVNPVKLYEYSAAGVPTVATNFSDDTREFGGMVLIAGTDREFADHLRTAVRRRGDSRFVRTLTAFAAENDWDVRARECSALLQLEGS